MSDERARPDAASFLYPDPPVHEDDANMLFVDREDEMEQAAEQMGLLLGRSSRRILAVVGMARVGKSHFLQQLVRRTGSQFDACVKVQVAQGVSAPAVLLRELLSRMLAELHRAIREEGLGPPEGPSPLLDVDQAMRIYAEAIYGRKMQISTTHSIVTSLAQKIGGNARLTAKLSSLWSLLQPFDVGGELSMQAERNRQDSDQRGSTVTVEVPPFTDEQLCELIGLAHTLASEARQGGKRFNTLVVIDDFDLLTRQANNTLNPRPLLESLYSLVQFDGLHVLTTVRVDTYENYDKNFHEVAYIAPFAQPDLLVQIFDRHVARYFGGQSPFQQGFIRAAAERSEGRAGIFLSFLRRAFTRRRAQLAELSFDDHLQWLWRDIEQRLPWAVPVLRKGVADHGGVLPTEDGQALRGTAAMQVLFEDYSSEGVLTVDPILRSYLREEHARS